MPEPIALTLEQTADALQVSPPTAYQLASRGVLPVVHLGPRLTRVPVDELRRRLAEQAMPAAEPGEPRATAPVAQ